MISDPVAPVEQGDLVFDIDGRNMEGVFVRRWVDDGVQGRDDTGHPHRVHELHPLGELIGKQRVNRLGSLLPTCLQEIEHIGRERVRNAPRFK